MPRKKEGKRDHTKMGHKCSQLCMHLSACLEFEFDFVSIVVVVAAIVQSGIAFSFVMKNNFEQQLGMG